MPPVNDRLDNYPDSPLKRDMIQAGLSIRGLAKKLAGSDDTRSNDQERTNVKRWLDPEKGISRESSERLAVVFRRPADHFYRQGRPRARQSDLLARLEDEIAANAAVIERLGETLNDVESRLGVLERRIDAARPAQGNH